MKVDSMRDSVILFVSGTSMMVALYSVFVGIFFFTYGATVERKALENQIENIVESLTGDILPFLSTNLKSTIKDKLEVAKTKILSNPGPDKAIEKSNKKVKTTAVEILAGISIVGIGISAAAAAMYSKDSAQLVMANLIKKNLLLLSFVAVIEFLFFTLVTQNYLSIDPNKVKLEIVNALTTD